MAKRALCIGINDYPGTGMDLRGCVNDADDWATTLTARGYAVNRLVDRRATKAAMKSALRKLVKAAKAGDSLVITFSGHGTYQPDTNDDEADGYDEGLCPWDLTSKGALTDDEIAAIVGKPMRNVAPEDVWDHLAGFAPANDVGAQDFRDTDAGSMLRVKGQDGFYPVGPGIVRGVDIRKERVRTYINGKVVQDGTVSEMTFPIDYIFADLSRHITFLPGDIVLTGTPANSRPMNIGDVVEVEVTGIGRISNTVQEAPAPTHKVGHQPTDSEAVRRVALGQF